MKLIINEEEKKRIKALYVLTEENTKRSEILVNQLNTIVEKLLDNLDNFLYISGNDLRRVISVLSTADKYIIDENIFNTYKNNRESINSAMSEYPNGLLNTFGSKFLNELDNVNDYREIGIPAIFVINDMYYSTKGDDLLDTIVRISDALTSTKKLKNELITLIKNLALNVELFGNQGNKKQVIDRISKEFSCIDSKDFIKPLQNKKGELVGGLFDIQVESGQVVKVRLLFSGKVQIKIGSDWVVAPEAGCRAEVVNEDNNLNENEFYIPQEYLDKVDIVNKQDNRTKTTNDKPTTDKPKNNTSSNNDTSLNTWSKNLSSGNWILMLGSERNPKAPENTDKIINLVRKKLNLPPNGKFDSQLKTAVENYQTENNLKKDGVVGKETFTALMRD